jgi:hypothetical protein
MKTSKQQTPRQSSPKMKTIGTRAQSEKPITEAEALNIFQSMPTITQIDTPTGYFLRPTQ